jgi:HlyD family secretion protein
MIKAGASMSRTTGRRAWAACAIGAAAVLALTACTAEPPPPPTLRVDRGSVQTTVSASGTLVGISEQTLGFPRRGQITEVLVGVGDRVVPGQELARMDDFALRQTLTQEQANLAEAQAELDRATGGNSVNATGRTLDQARDILDAVRKQVDEVNDFNRSATNRAREQLSFDNKVLDRAWDVLRRDEEACDDEGDSSTTPTPLPPSDSSTGNGSTGGSGSTSRTPAPRSNTDDDTEGASFTVEGIAYNAAPAGACERLDADRTAVENAKRTVLSSEAALDSAKHQEDVDQAAGKVSVEREQQTVISAENDSGAARNDRPADIEVRRAQLRNAQAAVRVAQQDVDNTTLYAPVAGVVSAINGRVGEFVGEASGTTPVAPGTSATIPESNDIAAGDSGGSTQATSAFMTLNNIDSYQLVVPFEESDAARIAVNQQVEVTVDAIPDLRAPATVLAIAPTGTPSSGIVEYNATIVLREGSDPRLRDGQTALADVVVEAVDNVLRVPSAAIRREGATTLVEVRGEDGQPVPTPFEAGAAGDEYTQVLSGLREGQDLLLPAAPPTPAAGGGPGG